MSKLPKGVHVVRKTKRDGTVTLYHYCRATGARLPDPSAPGFRAAFEEAKRFRPASDAGTVGALIAEFKRTPKFGRLSPSTLRSYHAAFNRLKPLRNVLVVELKRRHGLGIRDTFADEPGNALVTMKVLSTLMKFAIEREYRDFNPMKGIEVEGLGEHAAWPAEAVELARRVLPEYLRRALELALYTGQRRGDCAAMRWSQYDGEGITVTQIKTGAALWIACHQDLRTQLNAWRSEARTLTILTNAWGRPWAQSDSLGSGFAHALRRHEALDGLTFHGLRKTAAARLAEAGCTPHEIAAITGHRSLAMVQHYTKGADQKRRSKAAILKLETVSRTEETKPAKG